MKQSCLFCKKKFTPKRLPLGVAVQKYCGKNCRQLANMQRYADRAQSKLLDGRHLTHHEKIAREVK